MVFEFLFKYPPLLFQRGHVAFGTPWPIPAVLLGGGVVVAFLAYRGAPGRASPRQRLTLTGLRLGALGVLAFLVTGPTLIVPTVVPQQNFLAVLVDDSRSMRIADQDGLARGAIATRLLAPDGPLWGRLAGQFKLRLYRFAGDVGRIGSVSEVSFGGVSTHLGAALERVRQDFTGAPLGGIVVITDGADNAETTLNEAAVGLRAARVPVYAVGVGQERFARDIEVSRLDVPASTLRGSTVMADLLLTQTGYGNAGLPLYVEDAGRLVAVDTVPVREGEAVTVRVPFTLSQAGLRHIRVRVAPQPGEQLAENNVRDALIQADDRRQKILYFEGEPRFEAKFIRRAVLGDSSLQLVVLQRTAENKFLRLDVDTPEELVAGFPKTREELFRYRGLILGSVEASQFTHDQLQMISDFVGDRGGGLLLLGGRLAFAEGGYAGTPLADALPLELERVDNPAADSTGYFAEVKVRPAPAGRTHPALQLAPNQPGSGLAGTLRASSERWATLPKLTLVNRLGPTKAGATTLLVGHADGRRQDLPVLVFQRFGRGKTIAFTPQDDWLWQMHADIAPEDMTHETLWRQLLRWLISGVPDPVMVTLSPDRVERGDSVAITASVVDSAYASVNGASVVAQVTPPGGAEWEVPLEWTVLRDGQYRARFTADEAGTYRVRVTARRGGRPMGEGEAHVAAGSLGAEFFGAGMRRNALERLAQETGGRFYAPSTVGTLPDDVRYTESGATVFEQHDLWDMPIAFLLMLGLLAAEWGLRRARGLA